MRALFKTVFGSWRTVAVAAGAVALAFLALHGPAPGLAGPVLAVALLAGAGYLSRH